MMGGHHRFYRAGSDSYREPLAYRPARVKGPPGPGRSGRLTPRESQLGHNPTAERLWRETLRPPEEGRRRRRASSAPRARTASEARRQAGLYGAGISAAEKADDKDSEWRCGSYRYANTLFCSTLREWNGLRDMKDSDREGLTPDWRVSSANTMGLKAGEGAYGHDLSLNDTEGWKRSSPIWVESTFRDGLRDYKARDVGHDEHGNPISPVKLGKDKKFAAGTDLGNIYRSSKQCNVLSTARADEHFMGSLRSGGATSPDEYQRRRRAHLNLPQFKDLSKEEIAKAKRVFEQIDLDGSGTIDADEMRKFLATLGHKPTDKAVAKLIETVDEGVKGLQTLKEFARLHHGLML
jgi:hypothetical protein